METYSINRLPTDLTIGRQTETGVFDVRIDCAPWLAIWPELSLSIWVTPPGGAAAYPAVTHMEGDVLVWDVNNADTAVEGKGTMEVMGVADGLRKLSSITTTKVLRTTTGATAEPPESAETWVDQVLNAASTAAEQASTEAAELAAKKAAEEVRDSIPTEYSELSALVDQHSKDIIQVEDACSEGKYMPELIVGSLWNTSDGSMVVTNNAKRARTVSPIRGVNGTEARLVQTDSATEGALYNVVVMYLDDATGAITTGSWKTLATPMEKGTTYHFSIRDKNNVATAEQIAADLDAGNVYLEVVVLEREAIRADLERLNYGEIMVRSVAHRGDAINAPENTLAAYRQAVKNGYKYMESDVHFTADGVPVMLHDDTIDRTSNSTGNVADFTLAQLKELDFGSWFGEAYAGEQIPTFEEMLAFCRATGIIPLIELKDQTQAQVELLVDYVDKYGLLDKVHWVSFDRECLEYVRGVNPDANLCHVQWSTSAATAAVVAGWKTGKNEVGIFPYKNATEETAEICRAAGVYMMAGPVTEASEVLAAPAYVSWFTVDGVDAGRILYDNAMGVT